MINNNSVNSKYTIECKTCNKLFETKRKEAQYCSYECYWNSTDLTLKKQQRNAMKQAIIYNKKHGVWNDGKTKEDILKLSRPGNGKNFLNEKGEPWNKGKVGVYSDEYIEKIRIAVVRQYKEGRTKKINTKPEREFKQKLKEFGIEYEQSYYLNKKIFDFYLKNYNTLVEIDGIYWHGKNVKDKDLNETQLKNKINDKAKNKLAKENNMNILRFWEGEILSLTKEDILCYV